MRREYLLLSLATAALILVWTTPSGASGCTDCPPMDACTISGCYVHVLSPEPYEDRLLWCDYVCNYGSGGEAWRYDLRDGSRECLGGACGEGSEPTLPPGAIITDPVNDEPRS